MLRYYELLSRRPADEIQVLITNLKNSSKHPMEAKKELAVEITNYYYAGQGQLEREKFEARFSKNQIPDDIETKDVSAGELKLLDFLREVGFIESNGEGRRLIKQNALKIDNKAYAQESIQLEAGKEYILKLGKLRMVKMVVQ